MTVAAKPDSAGNVTALLALGTLLFGCMTASATAARVATGLAFDRHEVVLGTAERQTVLTGFLLDGSMADLAVLNVDGKGNRHLSIHAFGRSSWERALDATLSSNVLFVDVAHIGGSDRLVTYQPGRLNWFDPESGTERVLVAVTSNFHPPRRDEAPHVDITRDVNGDNRDDLVVPGVDGFRVFIQMADGAFSDPVKIGRPTDMSGIYGADGYRYDPWSQSRVHEIDYNRDGRGDLVFWNEDRFAVHLQDERGLFTAEPETFATEVAFDSDDLFSLATGDMTGRVLHSLADLNGDSVADLVVFSLQGASISSKGSTYEVYFGAPAPGGGTAFASEAGVTFQSDRRIQLAMDRHDFDGDGQIDLMLTTIDVKFLESSLWKRFKGMMGDDIMLELEFYQARDGHYPGQPNFTRSIALDGVPSPSEPGWVPLDIVLRGATHEKRRTQDSWPLAFNMILHIGDVTGDGRSDLLIGKNTPNGVDVMAGIPGPNLFSRRPRDVAAAVPNDEENTWLVAAPNDEEYTWLVDLNRDGKQDILMHHPFSLRNAHGEAKLPPGTEPHRVTLLIAR